MCSSRSRIAAAAKRPGRARRWAQAIAHAAPALRRLPESRFVVATNAWPGEGLAGHGLGRCADRCTGRRPAFCPRRGRIQAQPGFRRAPQRRLAGAPAAVAVSGARRRKLDVGAHAAIGRGAGALHGLRPAATTGRAARLTSPSSTIRSSACCAPSTTSATRATPPSRALAARTRSDGRRRQRRRRRAPDAAHRLGPHHRSQRWALRHRRPRPRRGRQVGRAGAPRAQRQGLTAQWPTAAPKTRSEWSTLSRSGY